MRITSFMNSYSTVRRYEGPYFRDSQNQTAGLNVLSHIFGKTLKQRALCARACRIGVDAVAGDGVGPEVGEAVAEDSRGHAV